jgi:hypothetical protein
MSWTNLPYNLKGGLVHTLVQFPQRPSWDHPQYIESPSSWAIQF